MSPPTAELRILADSLADAVNFGCEVAREMPIAQARMSGFRDYGQYLMTRSPILRDLVTEHPEWYPELARLAR